MSDVLLFELGSDRIRDPFIPLLELGTALMTQNPNVQIKVTAHTDSSGSSAFNQRISERRGEAVKTYWVEKGIDPSRITTVGMGESEATERFSPSSRRAEFVVSGLLG